MRIFWIRKNIFKKFEICFALRLQHYVNSTRFPNGTAKVDIIFELANFFKQFFKNFFNYFFIDAITP